MRYQTSPHHHPKLAKLDPGVTLLIHYPEMQKTSFYATSRGRQSTFTTISLGWLDPLDSLHDPKAASAYRKCWQAVSR